MVFQQCQIAGRIHPLKRRIITAFAAIIATLATILMQAQYLVGYGGCQQESEFLSGQFIGQRT